MASFHSLRSRLLLPLSGLLVGYVLFGGFGVHTFINSALDKYLHKNGQLISTALVISAETSSSLSDFHRSMLAMGAEPSIDNIVLFDRDYKSIFHHSYFSDNIQESEREVLAALVQQALATGLSVSEPDRYDSNIYQVVTPIYITALAQVNVLQPEAFLLLVRFNTEQARVEALKDAFWLAVLFLCIGLLTFTILYYLINELVLKPSQRIIAVMNAQSLNQDKQTSFPPIHELGIIGQTLDQLTLTLQTREQALKMALAKAQYTNKELVIAATIFESQESMVITDSRNVILRVNQAFTSITGYNAEEAIGHNPRMLSSGQHDAAFYEAMWQKINTTDYWVGEVWNKRKDGEVYPEKLTITAVKNEEGAVTNYVGTAIDITLSKQAEQEIHDLAYYDPVTHLPNRRLMVDRIQHAMDVSARGDKEAALLFLDLDHFKTLNDTLGHDMGDLLLQQVAERLRGCIRQSDTVSRFGGDEFVVLIEGLSSQFIEAAAQAEGIANKMLFSIHRPYLLASHSYTSSASIGITVFDAHKAEVKELLKQADIAMYQAKADGRNAIRFFDPHMTSTITARAVLEKELNQAIELEEFQLYYQIQVDNLLRPLGAEVLIRWNHPERGLVSPIEFIPVAEQTGTILAIGQWVLNTACTQLKVWQQDVLTRNLTLSVNVSAKQFHQADFISQVTMTIQQHQIDPARLKLELTESLLQDDIEDTIAKMNTLADIGIQFSLDDFGTGYSSLQYLKQLPLYQLKIDKSFVDDLVSDNNDQAIVRTIIAMAHSMELNVIAEGVETKEQQQRLLTEGCTQYQGYLYSKPVPIDVFEALLRKVDF